MINILYEEKDYEWAIEILSYPIRVNNSDMEARKMKATAVRMLGYKTENATWRNWYLTCAMALEGSFEKIVQQVGENAGFPPFSNSFIGLTSQAMFEALKVKVNGPRGAKINMVLAANVEEAKESYLLELRKGIVEVHTVPKELSADAVITATKAVWAKLITKELTIGDAVENRQAVCNHVIEAEMFFSFFDGFTTFAQMPFWLQ